MKRYTTNPLITLVQTLDDGIEFYRIAEAKTASRHLKQVFGKTADAREFALAYIRPYVNQHDLDFQSVSTYHGTLTNRYAELLDDIVADDTLSIVKYVEEQAIDAMIKASLNTHNALVQVVLRDLVPRLQHNFESLSAVSPIAA